jgi:signal transduction histidine kinase
MMTSLIIAWVCMTHLFVFTGILLFRKNNLKLNRALAAIMFSFGYVHLNHILIITNIITVQPWMHWVNAPCIPLIFMMGPTYFYYTSLMTGTHVEWRKYAWLHLLPITAAVWYTGSFLFKSQSEIVAYYEYASKLQPFDISVVLAIASVQGISYWVASIVYIIKYNQSINTHPAYSILNLQWLLWITISLIGLSIFIVPISLYISQNDISVLFITYPIISTCIYIMLMYKSLQVPGNKEVNDILLKTERDKIAQDLHDEMGGGLSTLAMISEKLENQKIDDIQIKEYGKKMRETSVQLSKNMSDIVWSLHPDNQSLSIFISKIREYYYDYLSQYHFEYKIHETEKYNGLDLVASEVIRNLHSTLKEALHNIVKHSKASTIDMKIHVRDHYMDITIIDNGLGFQESKVEQRGLRNMKTRIQQIGGQFEIYSKIGYGTEISIKNIPILKILEVHEK